MTALEVASPFDYATQGSLTVVHTRADPKQADAYTREMVAELMDDIEQVETRRAGAVYLAARKCAPPPRPCRGHLMDMVLVQGTQSRTRLLAAHTARVESGLPSVMFGMQVVWRRAGPARRTVRNRVHHQAAVRPAQSTRWTKRAPSGCAAWAATRSTNW